MQFSYVYESISILSSPEHISCIVSVVEEKPEAGQSMKFVLFNWLVQQVPIVQLELRCLEKEIPVSHEPSSADAIMCSVGRNARGLSAHLICSQLDSTQIG